MKGEDCADRPFRIVAVFTSTDPRDGGASWHQPLARNEDGEKLAALAAHLTGLAAAGRKAFHEGPLNRSFEDRHEALAAYEGQACLVRREPEGA